MPAIAIIAAAPGSLSAMATGPRRYLVERSAHQIALTRCDGDPFMFVRQAARIHNGRTRTLLTRVVFPARKMRAATREIFVQINDQSYGFEIMVQCHRADGVGRV